MNKGKIFIIIFSLLVLYAFWNGRNLLLGPQIEVSHPKSGQSFEESLVTIDGKVKNISFFTLNGRQIYADKEGNFKEDTVLLSGYNVIELRGKDRFGKEKIVTLKLYRNS